VVLFAGGFFVGVNHFYVGVLLGPPPVVGGAAGGGGGGGGGPATA